MSTIPFGILKDTRTEFVSGYMSVIIPIVPLHMGSATAKGGDGPTDLILRFHDYHMTIDLTFWEISFSNHNLLVIVSKLINLITFF